MILYVIGNGAKWYRPYDLLVFKHSNYASISHRVRDNNTFVFHFKNDFEQSFSPTTAAEIVGPAGLQQF